MEEITLREAKEYAKQMANFFKSFKLVAETLDHAVAVEELVKIHDEKLKAILKEIEELEKKKNLLMDDIIMWSEKVEKEQHLADEKIAEIKAETEQQIQQYEADQQMALEALNKFEETCRLNRQTISVSLSKDLAKYKEEFEVEKERLTLLLKEEESKLADTEAKLVAIKESLN